MNFEFSAGAFIYRSTDSGISLLILKRENKAYDLPKGHIERGETAEQAAIREIKEETGIDAALMPFFSTGTRYFFIREKKKILKRVKFFISKAESDSVKISEEHKGYEWCSIGDAASKLKYRDLVRILPSVVDYINRYEAMSALNGEYALLPKKQQGWQLSHALVPGEGPLNARLMLAGQAPGVNEDIKRRPFIGRSGQLLGRFIKDAKLKRDMIYITSVVQFFPDKNREPTGPEISACMPFFNKQVSIVKPEYILLLGRIAAKAVLGIGSITGNNGKIILKNGIKYMVTLHPSAVLRFPKNAGIMRKDFKALAEELKKG